MKISQKTVVITAVVVSVAVVVGAVVYTRPQRVSNTPSSSERLQDSSKDSAIYKQYAALEGQAYDKELLAGMIVHHGSAMNMAEQANASTQRPEILSLAEAINGTQGQETVTMLSLQEEYGFPITSAHNMNNMNPGETMDETMTMYETLQGLSGDEFDKKFLELMILHHQDAIDMSKPAATQSNSQKIKDLALQIISKQQSEISQMKQWQTKWGFVGGMKNS